MTLLGLQAPAQENQIKVIGDTLADAFMSKTEAIPHARIEEMTRRLANLEDFVTDDDAGELPLDKDSIELMLGIDASMIEVVSSGGSQPSAAMMAWANELQPGNWFTLDHNGNMRQVQYAWRNDRGQLHLFASNDGRSYIVQLRRLASVPAGRPAGAHRGGSPHGAGHARGARQARRQPRAPPAVVPPTDNRAVGPHKDKARAAGLVIVCSMREAAGGVVAQLVEHQCVGFVAEAPVHHQHDDLQRVERHGPFGAAMARSTTISRIGAGSTPELSRKLMKPRHSAPR